VLNIGEIIPNLFPKLFPAPPYPLVLLLQITRPLLPLVLFHFSRPLPNPNPKPGLHLQGHKEMTPSIRLRAKRASDILPDLGFYLLGRLAVESHRIQLFGEFMEPLLIVGSQLDVPLQVI